MACTISGEQVLDYDQAVRIEEHVFQQVNDPLNKGVDGHADRFVIAPRFPATNASS